MELGLATNMTTPKASMQTIKTRFGEVEYDPTLTIEFPKGPIGFENLHRFIVMPKRKDGPLFWIQSVEDPEIAFVLTDPNNFFLDYQVIPDAAEREMIGIGKDDECVVLAVVTVPPSRVITLNLMAPLLFAPKTNRCLQVVLERCNYSTKTPLPH